ncbi:hypothetical protein FHP29_15910 [Nocardioides albidus]|uniref:Uncharacterized protein n=1 Tax=Nocardioides albidus TaxID=1517589 RepID=A0A5C4VN49_9ACTN|nr:hypothetical protein [Nocardioides albidus]TNM37328.1 hypothetical protein FHP29_15910 [Nocardioides albidus]
MRLLGNARRTLPALILLVLAGGLAACSDDPATQPKRSGADDPVPRVVQDADAALDGVLHRIADELGLTWATGNRFYNLCGESYAPGGVVMDTLFRFDSSDVLTLEQGIEKIRALLEEDGWTVKKPVANPDSVILRATKGVLDLHLELAGGLLQGHLGSDCIETSDDVAREWADKPDAELDWS